MTDQKKQEAMTMYREAATQLTAADQAIQSLETDLHDRQQKLEESEQKLRSVNERLQQIEAGDNEFAQQLMDTLRGPIQTLKERLEKRKAAASPSPNGNAS